MWTTLEVGKNSVNRMCKYLPNRRCYRSTCSTYDGLSNRVILCPLFRGGDFHAPRVVEHDLECRGVY